MFRHFRFINSAFSKFHLSLFYLKGLHYIFGGRNINRYKPGGDWRWIKKNGEMVKMTYFAFDTGEPNGSLSASEDCIMFHASRRYRIHNIGCGGSYGGYICEK